MGKEGQLTIFIIVALVVVVGIAGYFIFIGNLNDGGKLTDYEEFNPTVASMKECFNAIAEDGVYYVGSQGGFSEKAEYSRYYFYHDIPYYVFEGNEYFPEMSSIEMQLADYVNEFVPYCVNTDNGKYVVEAIGEVSSVVKILDGVVMFQIDYSLSFSNGEKQVIVDEFSSSVDAPFAKAYEASGKFLESQKRYENEIPMGSLIKLSREYGFKFETLSLDDDDILYSFIFEENLDYPFVYAFVVDYDWEDLKNE